MSVQNDPELEAMVAMLARLHAQHDAQGGDILAYFQRRAAAGELDGKGSTPPTPMPSGKRRIPTGRAPL